jgi:hypothetical protein
MKAPLQSQTKTATPISPPHTGLLQRTAANAAPVNEVPAIVDEVLRSPGQPLDGATRAFMEPRFGHDFSQVRVHADGHASQSAQAVNALAYTAGKRIVFASGQYAPGTSAGNHLLAHELTHVVQQRNLSSQTPSAISQPSDPQERQAAAVAQEVVQMPQQKSIAPGHVQPASEPVLGPVLQAQTDETQGQNEAPAGTQDTANEGIEINPDELMLLPHWQFTTLSGTEASGAPTLQPQAAAASICDTPVRMRKVTSGAFEVKTLDDYFPDLVGKGYWGSSSTAGTFDTGSRAGSAVQLIGELRIPCDSSTVQTTLGQSATIVRAKADGAKMMENGKALEGQTINDIQRSGRDQSKAPFRQVWAGAVSMADPISGIPYASLKSYEWEVNLTTSLTGASGTVSVGWGVTVEASGGKVTKNEVR